MNKDMMSGEDAAVLAECEAVLSRNHRSFVEVGDALRKIRDQKLYRAEFGTFEAYCQERWEMSRIQAYRLIDAADVFGDLLPIGNTPQKESQARPLARLEPEQRQEAWRKAVETAPEGKVTAKHVEAVVKQFQDDVDDDEDDEQYTLHDAIADLGAAVARVLQRWPADYLQVVPAKLRDIAEEIEKTGSFLR